MKKKVIGSSILLLVLLLGLSTTCYANDYRDFTKVDIKNFLYKSFITGGQTEQVVEQAIQQHEDNGHIEDIVSALNTYKFCYITRESGTTGGNFVHIWCYNATNAHTYLYNNRITFKERPSGIYFNIYVNGTYNTSTSLYSAYNPSDYNTIFIGDNIYNGSNNNTIIYSAGTYFPSTLFDGPYQDVLPSYFEFEMNEYSSTQYVNVTFNGTTYNNVPVYYKPADTSQVLIGTLLNTAPVTLIEDFFGLVYWNGSSWVTRDIQERDLNTFVYSSPFLSIQNNSDMTEYVYGQQPRFAAKDCFYFYSIDDVDYNRAYAIWYIGSSHTIISGDKIDPITFNDYPDYDDNVKSVFNNIDDIDNIAAATEPILDTLTDDDQVSGELAGLVSGDASDIASRFGYSPVENPFTTVILDVMTDMTDILLGSGDQTLNFGFGGKNIIIHSSDFVLPSNRITNFLHLLVNGFFIWGIYKYGFTLYQWINSGRLQNLVNEANRHQYYLF